MKLRGRCLCGAVSYDVEGPPVLVFHCHCRDCQRAGGSLFHYGVMVRDASLVVRGEVRSFTSKSDEGRSITREFCPTCGSGLMNRLEMAPGMVVLRGGTLDDAGALRPTFELYTRSKAAWLPNDEAIRGFETSMTGSSRDLRWHP